MYAGCCCVFGDHENPKPKIPYVEIQREEEEKDAPIQISIEKVPTDDNDLIKNVLEEVYNVGISCFVTKGFAR